MTSPPLYKYLNIAGARLTLGNRCFRHAKPSSFNDTEDLTIRSLFPEDDETALAIIENGFTDLLLRHLDDEPTCLNEREQGFKSMPRERGTVGQVIIAVLPKPREA